MITLEKKAIQCTAKYICKNGKRITVTGEGSDRVEAKRDAIVRLWDFPYFLQYAFDSRYLIFTE